MRYHFPQVTELILLSQYSRELLHWMALALQAQVHYASPSASAYIFCYRQIYCIGV